MMNFIKSENSYRHMDHDSREKRKAFLAKKGGLFDELDDLLEKPEDSDIIIEKQSTPDDKDKKKRPTI